MRGKKKENLDVINWRGHEITISGVFHNLPGPSPEQCNLNLERPPNFPMTRLQLEHSPGPGTEVRGSHSVMCCCAGWFVTLVSQHDVHGNYHCCFYNVINWGS